VTNAFTESMNSVIRVADRRGRGYDFEVLRARVLFSRRLKYSRKSVKELERLAKTPAITKWLKNHLKLRLRKDTQGLEEGYTSHEIYEQHKQLARKYGDLCPGCGGQLQAKLIEFRQSLPVIERHLANTEFWGLTCRECGKKFHAYSPNPPLRFQPRNTDTQTVVSTRKRIAAVRTRAKDLRSLRDPSAQHTFWPDSHKGGIRKRSKR